MTNATHVSDGDSWLSLWESAEPLDWDTFLSSDLLASRRTEINFRATSYRFSGSTSFVASALLILHILRSHERLSSTYHRLVLGLSACDMVSSLFLALSSAMVPRELNYYIPHARGNALSCTVQGLFIITGFTVATFYNCSICLYYLSIIRYNKKDAYIRTNLEPWFHGVSIAVPLALSLVLLGTSGFNAISTSGPVCFVHPHEPPHCIGRQNGFVPPPAEGGGTTTTTTTTNFTIPCGRGGGLVNFVILTILRSCTLAVAPCAIIGTMFLMYMSVVQIEKKLNKYGVGSLRLSLHSGNATRFSIRPTRKRSRRFSLFSKMTNDKEANDNDNDNDNADDEHYEEPSEAETQTEGILMKLKRRSRSILPPSFRKKDHTTIANRSNRAFALRKRSVLYMALAYSMAWILVWVPFILVSLRRSYPTEILNGILTPSQGLCNFFVFMFSKVRQMKSSNDELSWFRAFFKAYKSRGERKRGGGSRAMRSSPSRRRRRDVGSSGLGSVSGPGSSFRLPWKSSHRSSNPSDVKLGEDRCGETELQPDSDADGKILSKKGFVADAIIKDKSRYAKNLPINHEKRGDSKGPSSVSMAKHVSFDIPESRNPMKN